ncbi:Maleylacetate reductase [Rhizobium sp. CF080]|nr:Maleylacetate reductase [Rhizobium sp. CF080]
MDFVYRSSPAEIIFGSHSSEKLSDCMVKLGCRRALVLSTAGQKIRAGLFTDRLGGFAAGQFSGAVMHTPVPVTEAALHYARQIGADCLVAYGGGSTIGLGKAIAYRTDLLQIVIPTTYAGSEVTSMLGQTENGLKTTLRSDKVLPEVVIYDPELTLGLPVSVSVTSGLNAIAHAAEGLYAPDRNPVSSIIAVEGMRKFAEALPKIVADPADRAARTIALCGAWLCGSVLGQVGMSLHHKICHTLGGSFNLPHAETHSVMLPHTIGFNAAVVPELLAPAAAIFGKPLGRGLQDFSRGLGAPIALRDLGLTEGDLDRAAELATQNPYANPRPLDRQAIRAMLRRAWAGLTPEG